MRKNRFLILYTLLFLTACLSLNPGASATPVTPAMPATTTLESFKAGVNPVYHAIVDELGQASIYNIEYVISDDYFHVLGQESVKYTNTEDVALGEVKFRLFANLLGGEMQVEQVKVDGELVSTDLSLNNSVLTLHLTVPLQPDESILIEMAFTVEVSRDVYINYGVQAYAEDVLALAHAYPMIAVYDDEGWNVEIPPQTGDIVYADMSFFVVQVDAPVELVLVGSGREVFAEESGGRQQVRYEAGPVRDFYLAGSPNYQEFIREVDGVTLRFYTRNYFGEGAREALDFAEQSIRVFNARYAPYPYTELDFVSTPTLALGIEYPGMVAITEWIMEPQVDYLEATVVL
jgi:hypothetical protein